MSWRDFRTSLWYQRVFPQACQWGLCEPGRLGELENGNDFCLYRDEQTLRGGSTLKRRATRCPKEARLEPLAFVPFRKKQRLWRQLTMNCRIYFVKKLKLLKIYDRINMQHIGIIIQSKQRLITYTLFKYSKSNGSPQ